MLESAQAGNPDALADVKPCDASSLTLQQALLVIARKQGFSTWDKLKAYVDARNELADCQRQTANVAAQILSTGYDESEQRPAYRGASAQVISPERDALGDIHRTLRRLTRHVAAALEIALEDADTACCTFCFTPAPQCRKLIAGTGVFICDECIGRCANLIEEPPNPPQAGTSRKGIPCSFCDKSAVEVGHLVVASNGSICNRCVEVCLQIVRPTC
ncbi:MAG: hypothetical protein OXU77_05110 [Gammaproteobacteria bacterium]|nr:hypothetical protein [Gammaproteobacteria bacterium]